jgi:hypothetical protein
MNKVEQIKELASTVKDPVFRKSLMMIVEAMELALEFKRLDMAFLQIRGESKIPKFALLDYDEYKSGSRSCELGMTGYKAKDGSVRFGELFARGDWFNDVTASAKTLVPETVDAIVQQHRERFDEILIAWEADWQPRGGDPIVIGRKGTYYYVVATWDMTELESFVAGTFAE